MSKKPTKKQIASKHNSAKESNKKTIPQNSNRLILILLAGALLTTFAVYFKVLNFPFINSWDDTDYVIRNHYIQSFSFENITKLWTSFFVANYQPITMMLYAVEYFAGNGSPQIFHGMNIVIHLINSYLVFVLIREISPKNSVVALITAAFFAIHPMHIESVAWVSELKDVLYSFFFLLGLIQYCRFIVNNQTKLLVYTFIFFLLSCLSKSAAVIFPLIMLLLDYYFLREFTMKTMLEKLPFFIVSLIFGVVAIHSQKMAIQEMAPAMTLLEHISIVSFSFLSYIIKLFVPVNLAAIYTYPAEVGHSLLPIYYYISIPLVFGLLFFVWYSRRWDRTIIFGFMFFVISIILVLQFIPVGSATMADRYSYIPYIGLIFILAKAYENLVNSPKLIVYKKQAIFILLLLFAGFTVVANERTKLWQNDGELFTDTINKYPNCPSAYINRGAYKGSKNDIPGAIEDQDRAISINPTLYIPYNNRGLYKQKIGDFKGALIDINKSIALKPNYYKAYFNRSMVYDALNNFPACMNDLNKVIELQNDFLPAYTNRGVTKCQLNNFDGAMSDFNYVIQHTGKDIKAYFNRGLLFNTLNRFAEAIPDFDKAIQLNPRYAEAYNNRAVANFNLNNLELALNDWNKAIEIDPNFTMAIKNRDVVIAILNNQVVK
ncbi:MAG: tetratricopeptide repeat protein [Paludibacter sp.]